MKILVTATLFVLLIVVGVVLSIRITGRLYISEIDSKHVSYFSDKEKKYSDLSAEENTKLLSLVNGSWPRTYKNSERKRADIVITFRSTSKDRLTELSIFHSHPTA